MRLRSLALSAIVCAAVAFVGVASAAERLGWEDLAPPWDDTAQPLQRLPQNLQADFYDLMWARSIIDQVEASEPTESSATGIGARREDVMAEMKAIEGKALAGLEAAGIDIAALIADAEAFDRTLAVYNETLVDGLDGRDVEIPGYALPLEYAGTQVSEFLLVPYVGACIHVPPPPPNQIVHVRFPEGFESKGLFTPVLVAGRISTGHSSRSLTYVDGSADIAVGYSLDASAIEIFDQ